MTTVRIATRGSELALTQSRGVALLLASALGVETELVPLRTSGDQLRDVSLAKVGGKGLFVKEIEEALLDGRADLAVHSAKDLPALSTPGLSFAAFPERADPRDALVGAVRGSTVATLSSGARVGTGSVRRAAQLRALRPDLEIVPLRGNVGTRLQKLESEGIDAVLLACAGLDRLGLSDRIDERIAPETLLPAVAQGALAVQGRIGDPIARDAAALSDASTTACVAAERSFLDGLSGDCNVPLAALAETTTAGGLRLRALVSSEDGAHSVRHEGEARLDDAASLGAAVADVVLSRGGAEILATLRAAASDAEAGA